jgi:hypothetical protein
VSIWARTKAVLWVGTLAAVLASACSRAPTSPSSSLSVGQWNGTTAQDTSITFTVSADETLTTIAVGYSFNGCSGTQTFSNLNVPPAPNVTCVPGPCQARPPRIERSPTRAVQSGWDPVRPSTGSFFSVTKRRVRYPFWIIRAAEPLPE